MTVAPVIREGRMLSGRDREYHDIGYIADVPVITGGCDGVQVKPNIEVGCIGSIVHYDSDITNYVVDGAIYEDAYTDNRHDLNDCFFLPGLTGTGNTFNTDGCYEIISSGVTFRLCENGFDIVVNGSSLIESLIDSNALPSDWGQT
ncbi:hypothetical protein N9043_01155 [bacterium]|nr:hypothetical protein [bacterium]